MALLRRVHSQGIDPERADDLGCEAG